MEPEPMPAYLGRVSVTPPLTTDEAALLTAVQRTRHVGPAAVDPLDLDEHPQDAAVDVDALGGEALRAPSPTCPWAPCRQGCCLTIAGGGPAWAAAQWLQHLVDVYLGAGARLQGDLRARRHGLSFDHVLDGAVATQHGPDEALHVVQVRENRVSLDVLAEGAPRGDEWSEQARSSELQSRQVRLLARQTRYREAVASDLRRGRAVVGSTARGQR